MGFDQTDEDDDDDDEEPLDLGGNSGGLAPPILFIAGAFEDEFEFDAIERFECAATPAALQPDDVDPLLCSLILRNGAT